MKNLIVICFAALAVMTGCANVSQKKDLDLIGKINKDIREKPSAAGGTNYYICNDGDDHNNGLSSDAPWKTYAKGMQTFNSMDAGDSILFCRGGVFNVDKTLQLYNFNCRADNSCTIGDYTPDNGSPELPILEKEAGVIAALYFKDPRKADHEEGVVIRNLNLSGSGDGYGVYLFNDIDDVLLEGLTITGFERGVFNGTGNTPAPGSDTLNERIVIDTMTFSNNERDIVGKVNEVGTVMIEPKRGGLKNKAFYVCDTGSDYNSGTSPDSPWYSFSRVADEFGSLEAGSSIAFCRGGTIEVAEHHRFINKQCRADNPCVFRDYYPRGSTGQEPMPILQSTNDGGIFYFAKRADTFGEGITISNLELIGNDSGIGVFVLGGVSDIKLNKLKISHFRIGVSVATNSVQSENISLAMSDISDNSEHGWLGGATNLIITDNNFENNGFNGGVRLHNIYLSGYDIDNVQVVNNRLYKSSFIDGKCTGVSLVAHGTISNLLIENNLVLEDIDAAAPTCFGIAMGPGYASEEWLKGVTIRNNTILNMGNVSIGCASCVDVLIEGNRISNSNQVFHEGIKVPAGKDDSLKTDRVVIRDNIIENYGEISRYKKRGIDLQGIPDLRVENNEIIYDNEEYLCVAYDRVEMGDQANICQMR